MTENKWFNDFRGYKRFDSYFDDYMQLWVVSDNENDNMLYPCISENMANEFIKLLNELNDENQVLKEQYADDCNEANSMTVKISELIEEKEQLKQSYNEFEDECQSTLNAMNRKQNDLYRKIFKLKEENEQLKQQLKSIEDGFKFSCTENYIEFNKDKLKVEDTHTEITLKDGKLCISVFIPQLNEYVKFFYWVTGRKMEREFINYDGDV